MQFGRLTLISDDGPKWLCECSCGTKKRIAKRSLTQGLTKSCGCYRKEVSTSSNTKHGIFGHKLYNVWQTMRSRCNYEKHNRYHRYGGRGIKVCEEWMSGVESFYNWAIENGYEDGLQLDRIDNDGDYTPENCRFVTSTVNARNSSTVRKFAYNGEEYCGTSLCEKLGINYKTFMNRIKKGLNLEQAIA